MENQTENKNIDSNMRRGFLKAATLMGLGTIAAGTGKSYAVATSGPEKKADIGAMLTEKRSLGSKKNPLVVSSIQLGCMGMHTGRGVHPDHRSMVKLIRDAAERGCNFFDTAGEGGILADCFGWYSYFLTTLLDVVLPVSVPVDLNLLPVLIFWWQ